MAARPRRAKKKIATARIPYVVPAPAAPPDRLESVLAVIYLVGTAGHTAPSGDELMRLALLDRALDLARMLMALVPDDPRCAPCSRCCSRITRAAAPAART